MDVSSSSITGSVRRPGSTCFCEEENAGEELASDAHAPAGREGAARDCDVAEEGVSEDGHFQREGELRARNREAAAKLNSPRASEDDEEDEDKHVSEDDHAQIGGGLQGMKREVTAKRNEPLATEIEIKNEEGQDKYVSADNYVQIGGWEQGRNRKASVSVIPNGVQPIGIEIQNKTNHCECLRAENQMLRLQIVSKTEELEAKQIQRLELELHLKTEENNSLKKQNEELRAENEYYRKTVSSTRNSFRTRVPVD
ncbi:hypothetical protein ZWY2020_038830 [Hordeum vulgare]|nr:hypothetical protein ZWY2020_038830 [Hordeum vulgare]